MGIQYFPDSFSIASLAVSCTVNTAMMSMTGFVSGDSDVARRGVVDMFSLAGVATGFGSTAGSPGYGVSLDLNQGGVINIVDFVFVASDFRMPAFQ